MSLRKEMEDIIINKKESVYISGYGIISDVNKLPSEAELAKGDVNLEKQAKANIKAQMDALKKQLALLDEEPKDEEEEPRLSGTIDTSDEDAQAELRTAQEKERQQAEATRRKEEEKKLAAVKKAEDAKK